jgi:bifunctional enzyme CysN/CysC/sulfate adenylyltransferase subunit 1
MILGPVEMGEAAPIEALATDKERPVLCLLPGRPQDAQRMQASFVSSGERAIVIDDDAIPDEAVPAVVRALQLAGVIAITARFLNPEIEEVAVEIAGSRVFRLNESGVSGSESH